MAEAAYREDGVLVERAKDGDATITFTVSASNAFHALADLSSSDLIEGARKAIAGARREGIVNTFTFTCDRKEIARAVVSVITDENTRG